jgi:hypothetical protein
MLTVAGHWAEEPGPLAQVQRLVGYGRVIREKRAGAFTQGASYSLTKGQHLKRLLERCGPWLQNPERRARAEEVAARLDLKLAPWRPATAAWALGFFEADGSLGLRRSGPGWAPMLQACSTVEVLPRTLQKLFGGTAYGPHVRCSSSKLQ